MLKHELRTKHTYEGDLAEIKAVIAWLIERHYWFECEYDSDHGFAVTCGVAPDGMPERLI